MARKFVGYQTTQAIANSKTIVQLVIATDSRVVLSMIEINCLGSSGATAPLHFQFGTQTTAGTASSSTDDLYKVSPGFSDEILTTALDTFTGEPSAQTMFYNIGVHQQNAREWRPPNGPIIMRETERWGLFLLSGATVSTAFTFHLEE